MVKTQKYVWRAEGTFVRPIESGRTLVVHVGNPLVRGVTQGDIVAFAGLESRESIVTRISIYSSFNVLLKSEGDDIVLPGMTEAETLDEFQHLYGDKPGMAGIYVFELTPRPAKLPWMI